MRPVLYVSTRTTTAPTVDTAAQSRLKLRRADSRHGGRPGLQLGLLSSGWAGGFLSSAAAKALASRRREGRGRGLFLRVPDQGEDGRIVLPCLAAEIGVERLGAELGCGQREGNVFLA